MGRRDPDDVSKYCVRCKGQVPATEWKYLPEFHAFRHDGEARGIVSWDPDEPDHRCMFMEVIAPNGQA